MYGRIYGIKDMPQMGKLCPFLADDSEILGPSLNISIGYVFLCVIGTIDKISNRYC